MSSETFELRLSLEEGVLLQAILLAYSTALEEQWERASPDNRSRLEVPMGYIASMLKHLTKGLLP